MPLHSLPQQSSELERKSDRKFNFRTQGAVTRPTHAPLPSAPSMTDTGMELVLNVRKVQVAMTRLNVSRARQEFPEILNRAAYAKERTIVSRRGKDLAAVIPIEELRLLERLAQQEMDRLDLEDARAALKEAEEKGTIPLRDLMRELGD